jgi:hypothetical protein
LAGEDETQPEQSLPESPARGVPGAALGSGGEEQHTRRIRLGGFLTSYPGSYAAAWRRLLPGTPQLALPTLYLQRHTFELLLKQILLGALATMRQRQVMDDLFGTLLSAGPVSPEDYDAAYTSHDLQELSTLVEKHLRALQVAGLPQVFHRIRALLHEVERGRPERLRYEVLFSRKSRRVTTSFDYGIFESEATYAPIDEVAALLEEIFEGQAAAPGTREGPVGAVRAFFDAIVDAEESAYEDVRSELHKLEADTRSGKIEWRVTDTPALNVDEHPSLSDAVRLLRQRYLVGLYQSRQLALVILKETATVSGSEGARREDEFFLAALRPNGTLTDGIFPDSYQSNLRGAIGSAMALNRDDT